MLDHITFEQQSLRGSCLCLCVGLDVQQAYGSELNVFRFQRRLVAACCCVGSIEMSDRNTNRSAVCKNVLSLPVAQKSVTINTYCLNWDLLGRTDQKVDEQVMALIFIRFCCFNCFPSVCRIH